MVEEGGRLRPFMRGIMVHALTARGVSFDDAYRTADTVRERLRGQATVPKAELAKAVREILGDAPFAEERPLALPVDIVISGAGEQGTPFSKGILSQSLLAAAIDPTDAFDVARDIERELLERGSREIARHELRDLTHETLARRLGKQTAERYRAWRRFQEPDRPVLILLGGTCGVGKSSLALEVAHRLGIGRVLSTDSIRQIMRIMLSQELVPAIHTSSYDAHRVCAPETLGDDPVVEGFRSQASTVGVGVRATIDRAIGENTNLVLDGVSLVPGLVDFEAYRGAAEVIFVVVATLDEERFGERFSSRGEVERRRGPHRYLEHLDEILRIQDHILELAERFDVPIVDNVSFDQSVLQIIRHVTETLRMRGDFGAAEAH